MINTLRTWNFDDNASPDAFGLDRTPDQSRGERICQPEGASAKQAKKYPSKHVLFNEGDDADTVYEVVDGMVMLYTISENGRRTVIGFLQKGDYFGFVMRDVHSYFAQTVGVCVVRSISRARLWREIREHHRAAEKFLSLEGNALENARKHMVLLTRKTPIERVSMFLLEMAARHGGDGDYARGVRLPMTRTDIADYLGLVVETVCRCLTSLKDLGMISMETRGQIEILDGERLLRYALGEERSDPADEILINEGMVMTGISFEAWADLVEESLPSLMAY